MAATAYRAPPDASEDSLSTQQTGDTSLGRTASYRRQFAYNGEDDYAPREPQGQSPAQIPRTQTVSYKNKNNPPTAQQTQNRPSHSFAERTKNNGRPNWMDKPLPPEPPEMPDESGYTTPQRHALSSNPSMPQESPREESTPPTNPTTSQQSTPLSRSGTARSTKSQQQHDWASDRSPLQKLEVALDGISKEEKRARVLEAELRVKERLERQKGGGGSERRESPAPSSHDPTSTAPAAKRRSVMVPSTSDISSRSLHTPQGINPEDRSQDSQEKPPREKARAAHGESPSFRYAAVPRDDLRYTKPSSGQPVATGTAPRRAVSVSHHPERLGTRPGNRMSFQGAAMPKRAVSQANPASIPPRKPVPRQLESQGLGQPPKPARPAQQRESYAPETKPQQLAMASGAIQPPSGQEAPIASSESTGQTKPKRHTVSFNVPPPTPPPLSEWKKAPVARLGLSDFEFQNFDIARSKAWWGGGDGDRRRSRALPSNYQVPNQKPKSYKTFQPALHLRSGPLLRYTGMRRMQIDGPNGPFDKVTWRGSVLIVTKDSQSVYEPAPTLRIFSQPMDLLPPPPVQINGDGLPPEYVDPTAGLMKLGRDGRPLYVKPVDHTEEEQDLSHIEDDDGIYEASASIVDYSSAGVKQPIPANRVHSVDGEMAGTYREMTGIRLYADPDRDVTFWRFNLEVELGATQQRIAYRLNQGPAIGFWVPAKGQIANIAFHSGNGFGPGVDTDKFCGPDPLWRDILNEHQTRPFHVMIGGGDQIYNDKVTAESAHFQEWLKIKNAEDQYDSLFDPEFRAEIENSFLEHYCTWFSQGLFSLVSSQIPMVNMWNDHEVIEGFGSYSDEFMQTPVISGLGRIAFKYYLLFQHHSVTEETDADEPSMLLGAEPGPYIKERSRNLFMSLGKGVALLGLDERTERMSHEVLSEPTCDLIWDRCHREITQGAIKHLIVLSSIPLAYPRMAMLKNILNSRKSLGKAGVFGGLVNRNGGKIEIFDDHWTAKQHKAERTYLIEDLQDLAAEKSIRVTVLSGDVHLAAMGQFYSNPKLGLAKDKDYRYMPNIIASGIASNPETEMVSDMLNRWNQVHHMDSNTDEDMIPIFRHDVDGKMRNNKRLLPRRNWCSIREYQPGSTPPDTEDDDDEEEEPRPGKLQRTLSLTRGDRPGGGLFRRLSGRGPPPTRDFNLDTGKAKTSSGARRMSMDGPFPPRASESSFFRRPSLSLSRKGSRKSTGRGSTGGDEDGVNSLVNLEGGLAITLNLELNPKDPAGITSPYKLLVPILRYDGMEYDPPATKVTKGWRKWLGVGRKEEDPGAGGGQEDITTAVAEEPGHPHPDPPQAPLEAEAASESEQEEEASASEDGERKTRRKKWFGL